MHARSVLCALLAGALVACGPPEKPYDDDGGTGVDARPGTWPDAWVPADLVTVRGTVWSPGADLDVTLEDNRFPIPGAAVIATGGPPEPLPQGRYCNECVEVPEGIPSTIADPVTGEWQLGLQAGRTYYLTIQKGEFRRSSPITVPDTPGGTYTIEASPGMPRPPELTLPSRTDPASGDNVPKVAMIKGSYEDMAPMFEALSFDYTDAGVDFDIFCGYGCSATPSELLNDAARLDQYNLIVVTCGEDWPGGAAAADNLKQWVKDGGKLYVDDFNYDFVEQVWPSFLTWYVDDFYSGGPCGPPAGGIGDCNNWSSYDFNGDPGDADFEAWLALSDVNRGEPLRLYAAWDYLFELGEGEIGIDLEMGTGPNHEVYREPKVWMFNADSVPWGTSHVPATVSWPFYCGKVAYTVYHTHSSGSSGTGTSYELLLQEKIMMFLIMEVQTCSVPPIVE